MPPKTVRLAKVEVTNDSGELVAVATHLMKWLARQSPLRLSCRVASSERDSGAAERRSEARSIGRESNMRLSMILSVGLTLGLKSMWATMSVARSRPGAISVRTGPPSSSRKTARSVT